MIDSDSHSLRTGFWTGLSQVARLLLTGILFVSGAAKLMWPYEFYDAVLGYQLVSPGVARLVVSTLPTLEVLIAIGLLIPGWRFAAGVLAVLCCLGFLVAQVSVLARGIQTGCGCFGPASSDLVGWQTLIRTAVILLLACVACMNFAPVGHNQQKPELS